LECSFPPRGKNAGRRPALPGAAERNSDKSMEK
jgi:hypothetical protein